MSSSNSSSSTKLAGGPKKVEQKKKWSRLQEREANDQVHARDGDDDDSIKNSNATAGNTAGMNVKSAAADKAVEQDLVNLVTNENANIKKEAAAVEAMRQGRVLNRIAANMPFADLRRIRETCKLWNDESVPSFGKKHGPIRLVNTDYVDKSWYLFFGHALPDFMASVRKSNKILYEKYDLRPDRYKDRSAELEEFFALCGPSTRSLSLSLQWGYQTARGLNLNLVRQLVFDKLTELTALELIFDKREPLRYESNLKKTLPKLEQLTLSRTAGQIHLKQMDFLVDLINGLTGLKSLIIKSGSDEFLPILRDSAPHLATLRRLEFVDQPCIDDLSILREMGRSIANPLRLRALIIGIHMDDDEKQAFYEFLVSQSDSLRHLEMTTGTQYGSNMGTKLQLPRLANLQELRINRLDGDLNRFIYFDGDSMTDNFPALQKLTYLNKSEDRCRGEVEDNSYNSWVCDDIDAEIMVHNHVTVLDLNAGMMGPHDEMRVLNKFMAFDAVAHLRLSMSVWNVRAGLGRIWSALPLLETAHIKFYNHKEKAPNTDEVGLDEALSGIPMKRISQERLRNKLLSNLTSLDAVRARLKKHKTGPGLSDSKNIRKLVLDFKGFWSCSPSLGEVGGYFGLAMASQTLEHFAILRRGAATANSALGRNVSISSECEAMIRTALGPFAELHF